MPTRQCGRAIDDFVKRWNAGERRFTGLSSLYECAVARYLRAQGLKLQDGRGRRRGSPQQQGEAMAAAWRDPKKRKNMLQGRTLQGASK
jgi:hypothetical protein